MDSKFRELDSSKYFSDAYKNDQIVDLVKKIQDGDVYKAKEELYLRLNTPIINIAKIYEKEYHSLENDWGEFYFAIIIATEKAIKWYDSAKGSFQHFWRKIVKFEKIRLIRNRQANKRIQSSQTVHIGYENDAVAEMMMYQYGDKENYISFMKSLFIDELMDKVLNFILEKYGNQEYRMLLLWLNYYSLEEIAKELCVEKKYILSRLYTIINSIRRNLDCREYI